MRACLVAVLIGSVMVSSAEASVSVTNVRSAQRAGTKLVDIYYDLAGTDAPFTVSVQISSDGGTTFAVPATSLTGDVGSGVQAGSNRHIVWDAGADWGGQYSEAVRFKVGAANTPPAPAGMVLIPAGSFQMGDTFSEGGTDQLPVHSVYVSAFFMDKYEVTKALWDEVAGWAAANGYDIGVGSASGKAANHPAYDVTWYECVKWCNARSQKEGLTPCYTVGGAVKWTGSLAPICDFSANGYRLPTEAEWEKAARGGASGRRFPWGDTISHGQANYMVSSDDSQTNYFSFDVAARPLGPVFLYYHPTYNDGTKPYTSPVGAFAPSGYGLCDMVGNLWEWCWDWYSSSYYSTSPGSDPRGPSSWNSYRVLRGGSWSANAMGCRSAHRYSSGPTSSGNMTCRSARSSVP